MTLNPKKKKVSSHAQNACDEVSISRKLLLLLLLLLVFFL